MTPIFEKITAVALVLSIVFAAVKWHDHGVVKNEDLKIENKSAKTVAKIQERKNEIIREPASDARSIDRLQRGSFFPTR